MRKWIHRGLKGLSLTTALFVFQACYGTPMTAPEATQIAAKMAGTVRYFLFITL